MKFEGEQKRQCEGKVQHETEKDAVRAAKRLHKLHKIAFNTYRCPHCDAYHTGGSRSPDAANRRAAKMSGIRTA